MRFGRRGSDHVQGTARHASCLAFRHRSGRDRTGSVAERQESACNNACDPSLPSTYASGTRQRLPVGGHRIPNQSPATVGEDTNRSSSLRSARRSLKSTASSHPTAFVDDIGVENAARQRATLRPSTRGRDRSRPAPTTAATGETQQEFRCAPGVHPQSAPSRLPAFARLSARSRPAAAQEHGSGSDRFQAPSPRIA